MTTSAVACSYTTSQDATDKPNIRFAKPEVDTRNGVITPRCVESHNSQELKLDTIYGLSLAAGEEPVRTGAPLALVDTMKHFASRTFDKPFIER